MVKLEPTRRKIPARKFLVYLLLVILVILVLISWQGIFGSVNKTCNYGLGL
jgi:hypothetical protein